MQQITPIVQQHVAMMQRGSIFHPVSQLVSLPVKVYVTWTCAQVHMYVRSSSSKCSDLVICSSSLTAWWALFRYISSSNSRLEQRTAVEWGKGGSFGSDRSFPDPNHALSIYVRTTYMCRYQDTCTGVCAYVCTVGVIEKFSTPTTHKTRLCGTHPQHTQDTPTEGPTLNLACFRSPLGLEQALQI